MRHSPWLPALAMWLGFISLSKAQIVPPDKPDPEPEVPEPDPPKSIPQRATDADLRWQPLLDFDTDSCYNVPAIGCDYKISTGWYPTATGPFSGTQYCRSESDLRNTNVYSRKRCNHGWCVYMYDYYWEVDFSSAGAGHQHDWEHIAVFASDVADQDASNTVAVCTSAHGEWDCEWREDPSKSWDGDHPKVVYHKDSISTHAFRVAKSDGGDEPPENHFGQWQRGPLVSWEGFPTSEHRKKLDEWDFGSASFAIGQHFNGQVESAFNYFCKLKGHKDGVCKDGTPDKFDPATDDDKSPGNPQQGGNQCETGGGDPGNGEPEQPPTLNRPSELRILPLGASIMSGWGSTYGEGLRKQLRLALRNDGFKVDMVGSQHSTWNNQHSMKDDDHEGIPGDKIEAVHNRLVAAIKYKPNIIIINAGTNDANAGDEIDKVASRMTAMLNSIFNAEDLKQTCVIVSTILASDHGTGKLHYKDVNTQIRQVVNDFTQKDKCVYLADMDPSGEGAGWISQWGDYIDDRLHPNDVGHKKMAYVFYNEIRRALRQDKIKNPSGDLVAGPVYCDKVAGNAIVAGKTQKGSGEDDGIYLHSSQDMGVVAEFRSAWDRNQFQFGRMLSADYDDLLIWYNATDSSHKLEVWRNSGDGQGKFSKMNDISIPFSCIPRGLHFIDMNADGLDDIVCISASGDLFVATNDKNGDRAAGRAPSFTFHGMVKQNVGAPQARVRVADIDGDGRGDYVVDTNDNGDWQVWRNGLWGDKPTLFQNLGTRFTAKHKSGLAGVRFADLNGDGRDDWIYVETSGRTDVYTNSRSCIKPSETTLNIAWRQGHHKDWTSGEVYTHAGLAGFQNDNNPNIRERVHFARVYGSSSAFGNRPRQDYVFFEHGRDGSTHTFKMRVYKNTGVGATKLRADGVKYCNMMGHSDGREDYVWTLSTGKMSLRDNLGKTHVNDDEVFWGDKGVIWEPPRNMDRRDLHLADYDGDGACDIIYVDPNTGGIEVFINEYKRQGKWVWNHNPNPAPSLRCGERRGLGIHDLSVRFAHIAGTSRADYLCIQKDGTTSAWLQSTSGVWSNWGQIKKSEGKDRANLRWGDANGDGKDDMIFVDRFSGDAWVWYNKGLTTDTASNSGSSVLWRAGDRTAYDGTYAGTCQYFPNLNGDTFADLHSITSTITNEAMTYLNPGCGAINNVGDDGSIVNPDLPHQPGNSMVTLPNYN